MEKNYAKPVYLQIVDKFKQRLTSGKLTPGERLPKEAEFAREFGVTRTTLRNAFGVLEKEGFIVRKRSAGTCVAPKAMHNKHLHADLAIVKHYEARNKEVYSTIFEDQEGLGLILREAAADGMILRFIPIDNDNPFFEPADLIFRKGIDGFIVSSPTYVTEFIDIMADNHIPHVLLETHYDRRGTNSVVSDEEYATFELIREFYEHGHREIGFCGGLLKQPKINSSVRRYLEFFNTACQQFGMTVKDEWISNVGSDVLDNIPIDNRELAAAILNCKKRPTAIFSPFTRSTQGVIDEAHARGLKIPRDLSLVCGNCFEKVGLSLDADITGFGKDHELFARTGFEHLIEWIRDPQYRPTCVKVPMIKVKGKSIADV